MSFYRITGIFSFIFYLTHCKTRALIRLVFAKLTLNEGKLSWEYSKAFKILSEAVEATNCPKVDKIDDFENGKFELTKKPDSSTQKDALLPLRPIWLPGVDSNHEPCSYTYPHLSIRGGLYHSPNEGIARLVSEPSLNRVCSGSRALAAGSHIAFAT